MEEASFSNKLFRNNKSSKFEKQLRQHPKFRCFHQVTNNSSPPNLRIPHLLLIDRMLFSFISKLAEYQKRKIPRPARPDVGLFNFRKSEESCLWFRCNRWTYLYSLNICWPRFESANDIHIQKAQKSSTRGRACCISHPSETFISCSFSILSILISMPFFHLW